MLGTRSLQTTYNQKMREGFSHNVQKGKNLCLDKS